MVFEGNFCSKKILADRSTNLWWLSRLNWLLLLDMASKSKP